MFTTLSTVSIIIKKNYAAGADHSYSGKIL
jgi:hypothetical protein